MVSSVGSHPFDLFQCMPSSMQPFLQGTPAETLLGLGETSLVGYGWKRRRAAQELDTSDVLALRCCPRAAPSLARGVQSLTGQIARPGACELAYLSKRFPLSSSYFIG